MFFAVVHARDRNNGRSSLWRRDYSAEKNSEKSLLQSDEVSTAAYFIDSTSVERYSDFDGVVFQVVLNKGRLGIGLSIAGGKGADTNHIFVIEVKPRGPADMDGRIRPGDEILEVLYN